MFERNCFKCDLTCFDSVGMEIDITELPMKIRREIANAIISGHKFGTFEGDFEDNELMSELHPIFACQLREISETHKNAVEGRKQESATQCAAQQKEESTALEEKERAKDVVIDGKEL